MIKKQITQTKIVKRDDEYIVKAYDDKGQRLPECDYYTNDLQDAKDTAKAMKEVKA